MENILIFVVSAIALKSILVGSSFSIHLYLKYGQEYWNWYDKWSQQKFVHGQEEK